MTARRLAWWSEEIAAAFRGAPRHPISQALAPAIRTFGLDIALFETILAAGASELVTVPYERLEELEQAVLVAGGALGALTAAICGHDDARTPEAARTLGARLHFAMQLRDLGRAARHGRTLLPLEDLRRFGLAPHDLRAPTPPDPLARLLAFETARADQWLGEALDALPAADRRRLLPLTILARIERATLRELARDGAHLLERGVTLTPLRKLWIAWRSARLSS